MAAEEKEGGSAPAFFRPLREAAKNEIFGDASGEIKFVFNIVKQDIIAKRFHLNEVKIYPVEDGFS